jgi:pimeloyl-ACP methyl ester carboxylesterase
VWRHWLEFLTREHCLVRYDARGNGLSDWQPPSITFEDFVDDLVSAFDAAGVTRAPVLGMSQGAVVAVSYAARHPERVSALVLVSGCARGWRVKNNPRLTERFEALMLLMRHGWAVKTRRHRRAVQRRRRAREPHRGARFAPLDSLGHLLLDGEPAWDRFSREVSDLLRDADD